ncbi:MAG TPA: hypothetical protein ENK93_02830 [Campylobacteraceae bacterium]|nr:hypothetical protein [Campylobacteraceae bacterium]
MAEIKEIVEKSKKVLEELEERVEDATEGMSEEAKETWSEIRSNFTAIGEKLKNALNMEEKKEDLASKLEVIEAKEKLVKIKEGAEAFTDKVAQKTEEEIDMAALRAHLAKEEAEELWEEKRKELSRAYQEKEYEVKKMAKEAAEEVETFFENLLNSFKEKKA